MKLGKVSQAVLDRSVLRPLSMAWVLRETESASVSAALGGPFDRTVKMVVLSAANHLAASGVKMQQIALTLLFPAEGEEKELKALFREIADVCKEMDVKVAGGHTEVSDAVNRPILSVTGYGTNMGEREVRNAMLRAEEDLVMTGWIGMGGSAVLAKNMEKALLKRFPYVLINEAKQLGENLSVQEAAKLGYEFGVSAMHDVSQGGIFGALWEMAERGGVGLEVDLKKLPVRQETIEICEYFDLNPYQLYGQGALLLGTDRGEALTERLGDRGIPAVVIGRTNAGKDRVLRNGEDIRFLDRPAQDALWNCMERKEERML